MGRFKGWADPLIGSEEARSGAFLAANTCPHYLQTLDSRELGFLSFLLFSFVASPLNSFSIKYAKFKLSDDSSNRMKKILFVLLKYQISIKQAYTVYYTLCRVQK